MKTLTQITALYNNGIITQEQYENSLDNKFGIDNIENVITTDSDNSLNKDHLSRFDVLHTYYNNSDTIDSSSEIFESINDEGEKVYILNPANSDEYLEYAEEDLGDLIENHLDILEVWNQGSDELKNACFGEDCEIDEVIVLLENEDESPNQSAERVIIIGSIDMTDCNIINYSLPHIGVDENGALYAYNYNNCNTTVADRPSGIKIEINELMKEWQDKTSIYSEDELKEIFELWLRNN